MGRGPDRKPRKRRTDNPVPPPNRPGRNQYHGLPKSAAKAIRAANRRVPDDATEEDRQVAQEAFDRIVDVMRGKVQTVRAVTRTVDAETGEVLDEGGSITVQSPNLVLQAAKIVREDICQPHSQRIEHSGDAELIDAIRDARIRSRTGEQDAEDDA